MTEPIKIEKTKIYLMPETDRLHEVEVSPEEIFLPDGTFSEEHLLQLPEDAYGFHLCEYLEVEVSYEEVTYVLRRLLSFGDHHYYGGELITADEAQQRFPDHPYVTALAGRVTHYVVHGRNLRYLTSSDKWIDVSKRNEV